MEQIFFSYAMDQHLIIGVSSTSVIECLKVLFISYPCFHPVSCVLYWKQQVRWGLHKQCDIWALWACPGRCKGQGESCYCSQAGWMIQSLCFHSLSLLLLDVVACSICHLIEDRGSEGIRNKIEIVSVPLYSKNCWHLMHGQISVLK